MRCDGQLSLKKKFIRRCLINFFLRGVDHRALIGIGEGPHEDRVSVCCKGEIEWRRNCRIVSTLGLES